MAQHRVGRLRRPDLVVSAVLDVQPSLVAHGNVPGPVTAHPQPRPALLHPPVDGAEESESGRRRGSGVGRLDLLDVESGLELVLGPQRQPLRLSGRLFQRRRAQRGQHVQVRPFPSIVSRLQTYWVYKYDKVLEFH